SDTQLPKAVAANINYNLIRCLLLFRSRNINAPYPFEPNSDDPFCGDGMRRPAPARGNLLETESAGRSIHHGLAFGFQRRAGRLSFFGAYTLARTRDDVSFPADNYNLKPEWARSSNDRRHSFNLYLMMDLPRGLKLTPSLSASSGAPFNISAGLDDNRDTQFNDRPPGVARNADLPASLYSLVPRLDRSVSAPGGPRLSLGDYLATYFPHGVRAQVSGLSNLNPTISLQPPPNPSLRGAGPGGGRPAPEPRRLASPCSSRRTSPICSITSIIISSAACWARHTSVIPATLIRRASSTLASSSVSAA